VIFNFFLWVGWTLVFILHIRGDATFAKVVEAVTTALVALEGDVAADTANKFFRHWLGG